MTDAQPDRRPFAGGRCLAARVWLLAGSALFLWLFWRLPVPLWARLTGWSAAGLLLIAMPSPPSLQRWYRAALDRAPIRRSRFPRVRPAVAARQAPSEALEAQRRTTAHYLLLRDGGLFFRSALGVTAFVAVASSLRGLLDAAEPSELLGSTARPMLPLAIENDGLSNRLFFVWILLGLWIAAATLLCRFERARLEQPPGGRLHYAAHVASHLFQQSLALVWSALFYFFATLFLGFALYLVVTLVHYHFYHSTIAYLNPMHLRGRPLVELLAAPLLGMALTLRRARLRLHEAVARGISFTTSALERQSAATSRRLHRGASGLYRRI